ncbi:MAG: hypothetical protein H6835_08650 [Planctomycetes bacterium]|nr:hypothetical protein [Planctomycetota bacterium]
MTATSNTNGEAFALELLRDNPALDYAEAQHAANEAGVALQPIQFGRARRQLGLTSAAPAAAPTPHPDAPQAVPAAPQVVPAVPQPTEAPVLAAAKSERKGGSPAFEWLVESLRNDQTLSFGELKQRGEPLGHSIAPIMYGRAKALLGLVPVRPRGAGKRNKGKVAVEAAAPAPATPPRSLQQVDSAGDAISRQLDDVKSIDELVQVVRKLDAERRRLRTLLEQIANTIDEALGYAD